MVLSPSAFEPLAARIGRTGTFVMRRGPLLRLFSHLENLSPLATLGSMLALMAGAASRKVTAAGVQVATPEAAIIPRGMAPAFELASVGVKTSLAAVPLCPPTWGLGGVPQRIPLESLADTVLLLATATAAPKSEATMPRAKCGCAETS